jgi:hypothetical protein
MSVWGHERPFSQAYLKSGLLRPADIVAGAGVGSSGQKRTCRLADDLIGSREQRVRNNQPEL